MILFRKINFTVLLILISFSGFTQKTKSYNIKDYFLLLPDSLLKSYDTSVSSEQRQLALTYKTLEELWNHKGFWQIDTLDYKNGYMKFSSTGDGGGTEFEITYFIKKDKTREIAVNTIYWDIVSTYSDVKIYTFEQNIWKDITKKVFPEIKLSYFTNDAFSNIIKSYTENSPVLYKLPQKGKTITAKIDIGIIDNLFDENYIDEKEYTNIKKSLRQIKLVWDKGNFKLQ